MLNDLLFALLALVFATGLWRIYIYAAYAPVIVERMQSFRAIQLWLSLGHRKNLVFVFKGKDRGKFMIINRQQEISYIVYCLYDSGIKLRVVANADLLYSIITINKTKKETVFDWYWSQHEKLFKTHKTFNEDVPLVKHLLKAKIPLVFVPRILRELG